MFPQKTHPNPIQPPTLPITPNPSVPLPKPMAPGRHWQLQQLSETSPQLLQQHTVPLADRDTQRCERPGSLFGYMGLDLPSLLTSR